MSPKTMTIAGLDINPIPYKKEAAKPLGEWFVIACQSRYKFWPVRTLILVDRRVDDSCWWRPSLFHALTLETREEAQAVISKLKYNKPTILTRNQAMELLDEQRATAYRRASSGTQSEMYFDGQDGL